MNNSNESILTKTTTNFLLAIVSIGCLLPFLLIISASLTKEKALIINGFTLFPSQFSLDAYKLAFSQPEKILNSYLLTIFVTACGTIGGVLVMCGMAYPLSRMDFKYRSSLSMFLYITMVFSGGIVPSYIIISRYLKLSNNILVLIIPMLVNVFNVYLLRTFFQNIPTSIIEAAKIDGMSDIYIFFKICMPLSITGVVTVGLFTALGYWNDWWYNFLYITDGNIVNLQYMLYKVMANANFILQFPDKAAKVVDRMDIPAMSLRMATCILAAGPMTIAFMFLQKYFIRGITAGAVKG